MRVIALVAEPADPAMAEALYSAMLGDGWTVNAYGDQRRVPDDVAVEAEYIVVANPCALDASLLSRTAKVRLIQVPGLGVDHVRLADAAAAGIPVATIESSGAEERTVAEMALLLAGAASRRILQADRFVRAGGFGNVVVVQGGVFELAGKTLGIVGLGRIGVELAKRAVAFDMHVLYTKRVRLDVARERELGVEFRDLDALLAESDIVSLHVPLTPETKHLICDRTIALMKPGAVLVNTARGALIDDEALASAIRERRIRAAALDVFDPEPPPQDNPLLGLDDVILSPHMAGVSSESLLRIITAALENCRRVAAGEPPLDVVSPER